MNGNETLQSCAQNDTEIKPFRETQDFENLRNTLITLDADDARVKEKTEEYRAVIEKKLEEISLQIGDLEEKYSGDPEFEAIKVMLTDIECDFLNQKDLDIDITSFAPLLEEAKKRISSAGIEVKNSDEAEGETLKMVERMKELGMRVEYVAIYPNAKDFHILILQAHPNPGMSKGMQEAGGIIQSQKAIEENLMVLNNEGVKLVYGEGIPVGMELTDEIIKKIDIEVSYLNAEQQLGDKMYLGGVENMPFVKKTRFEVKKIDSVEIRLTVNNICLASNFAKNLEDRGGQTSIVVMGMGHELSLAKQEAHPHPFPLSKAIAYETKSNVIVINEAHYFNLERFQAYAKAHPKELDDVVKAIQG
ncbi:MAG: hypothetical protein ABIE14_01600 [Patescibacteria group bacterium]